MRDGADHNPKFKASVVVNGINFDSLPLRKSSKEAHNEAAKFAFLHFTNGIYIFIHMKYLLKIMFISVYCLLCWFLFTCYSSKMLFASVLDPPKKIRLAPVGIFDEFELPSVHIEALVLDFSLTFSLDFVNSNSQIWSVVISFFKFVIHKLIG